MVEVLLQQPQGPGPIDPADWSQYFDRWMRQPELTLPTAPAYELTLRLTDDQEIRQLNNQYRHQDRATDVLAFATCDDTMPRPEEEALYLGDIIISLETAQRQAQAQGHSLATETLWLASHGFLHLLGWDHPDADSLAAMLAQQQSLLGTIEVVGTTWQS
jgi:probable rRNA maturation factor